MQVTKSVGIVTTGVLVVTVSAPAKDYKGKVISMTAIWDGGAVGPYGGSIAWGDGLSENYTSTVKSVTKSHTYTTVGSKTITVTVYDESTGASGTGTTSITIAELLTASLSADKTGGPVPLVVTFTLAYSGGFTPYTGTLEYGDGASDPLPAPGTKAHTYTTVGTYTAKLTVTDALGAAAVRLLDLFAGVVPPTLLDAVTFALASIPLLVVGGTIVANELQRARVWG